MENKTKKLSARLLLGIFTLGIAFLNVSSGVLAAVTTPTTINYQGRLLSAANAPLAGNYTFRFSIWNTSDWVAGDTTGGGAINVGSAGYAGWQETHAVTIAATDYGLFNMNLGDTTLFPSFDAAIHKNLQVEVKVTGALDTTYEILDPQGTLADAVDRKPLQNQAFAQNADTLDNKDLGSMLRSDANSALATGNTLTVNAGATIASNGAVDLSNSTGNRLRESANPNALAACATLNEIIIDTSSNSLKVCTVTGAAGAAIWSSPAQSVASGAVNPGTCSVGQLFVNTASGTLQVCTALNTWNTAGPQDFESIFAKDADKTLTTNNNAFTIAAGTSTIALNGQGGVNLNTAVNGPVSIGNGTSTVGIASSSWNISTAGVASGLTGLSSTGTVNFSSSGQFRMREVANAATAACTAVNELVLDTTANQIFKCTAPGAPGTWVSTAGGAGSVNFENVYTNDADKTLTTGNGPFTIAAGSGAVNINSTNASGVSINNSINGNVNIGTGTSTGTVSIGGGAGTVQISSADWNISSTGDMTNIGSVTMDGLLTGTAGATVSGGAISLNNSSNFTVKIGTGTSTGAITIGGTGTQTIGVGNGAGNKTVNVGSSNSSSTTTILSGSGMTWINDNNDQDTNLNTGTSAGTVNIGGGSGAVAVNSSTWDITTAGQALGFTGITSTGKINFAGSNGFRIREIAVISNPGTACTNVGELIMETTTSTLYACTDAVTDSWQAIGPGTDAATLSGLSSSQFLRSDTSDNYTSGTLTFSNGTTLTVNGVANIGDGGDAVAVNSNTWDISSAGVASGFTGMSSSGIVNFAGSEGYRIREVSNPNANASCNAINELVMNTANGQLMRCTSTGVAGVATWTNVDTTGGSVDFEGLYANDADKTLTTSNGNFTINTGTGNFIVNSNAWAVDALGNITTAGTVDGVDISNLQFSNIAARVKKAAFSPDYAGGSSKPDGTNNKGTLKLDFEDLGGTAKRAYYEWTTGQAALQDMDIVLSFQLPLDFVSFTATPVNLLYKTSNGMSATNAVDVTMYDTTGAAVVLAGGTNLANAAWTNAAITFVGAPTFTAGDTITIRVKLLSTSAGFARISDLVLNYNGR